MRLYMLKLCRKQWRNVTEKGGNTMSDEIITTAPAEEEGGNNILTAFLDMIKGILKTILPIIGLGFLAKYF